MVSSAFLPSRIFIPEIEATFEFHMTEEELFQPSFTPIERSLQSWHACSLLPDYFLSQRDSIPYFLQNPDTHIEFHGRIQSLSPFSKYIMAQCFSPIINFSSREFILFYGEVDSFFFCNATNFLFEFRIECQVFLFRTFLHADTTLISIGLWNIFALNIDRLLIGVFLLLFFIRAYMFVFRQIFFITWIYF